MHVLHVIAFTAIACLAFVLSDDVVAPDAHSERVAVENKRQQFTFPTIPTGFTIPDGFTLPKLTTPTFDSGAFTLPKDIFPTGGTLPPGYTLPYGLTLPSGLTLPAPGQTLPADFFENIRDDLAKSFTLPSFSTKFPLTLDAGVYRTLPSSVSQSRYGASLLGSQLPIVPANHVVLLGGDFRRIPGDVFTVKVSPEFDGPMVQVQGNAYLGGTLRILLPKGYEKSKTLNIIHISGDGRIEGNFDKIEVDGDGAALRGCAKYVTKRLPLSPKTLTIGLTGSFLPDAACERLNTVTPSPMYDEPTVPPASPAVLVIGITLTVICLCVCFCIALFFVIENARGKKNKRRDSLPGINKRSTSMRTFNARSSRTSRRHGGGGGGGASSQSNAAARASNRSLSSKRSTEELHSGARASQTNRRSSDNNRNSRIARASRLSKADGGDTGNGALQGAYQAPSRASTSLSPAAQNAIAIYGRTRAATDLPSPRDRDARSLPALQQHAGRPGRSATVSMGGMYGNTRLPNVGQYPNTYQTQAVYGQQGRQPTTSGIYATQYMRR